MDERGAAVRVREGAGAGLGVLDGAGPRPQPRRLETRSTLPRELVRKDGVDSVFLTDIVQVDESTFDCAGQVPRAHSLLNDTLPPRYDFHDLSLLTEVGRQAVLAALHGPLGVPRSKKFVFTKLTTESIDPEPNGPMLFPVPLEVRVEMGINREGSEIRSVRPRLTWRMDGRVRARTGGVTQVYDRPAYDTMRHAVARNGSRDGMPPVADPVDPAEVGRRNPANVFVGEPVLDDGQYRAPLLVDETNPFFFDHPDEHIPGTMLVEGLRQLAILAACRRHGHDPSRTLVVTSRATFVRFAELDVPTWCCARVDEPEQLSDRSSRVNVRTTLEQQGSKVVAATLGLHFV